MNSEAMRLFEETYISLFWASKSLDENSEHEALAREAMMISEALRDRLKAIRELKQIKENKEKAQNG